MPLNVECIERKDPGIINLDTVCIKLSFISQIIMIF